MHHLATPLDASIGKTPDLVEELGGEADPKLGWRNGKPALAPAVLRVERLHRDEPANVQKVDA